MNQMTNSVETSESLLFVFLFTIMPLGKQAASPKKIPKWVQCSDRFFLKALSGCTAPPAFATGEQAIEAA